MDNVDCTRKMLGDNVLGLQAVTVTFRPLCQPCGHSKLAYGHTAQEDHRADAGSASAIEIGGVGWPRALARHYRGLAPVSEVPDHSVAAIQD